MKYRILAIFLSYCLSTAFAAETYGPISKQDTLWSIASRVRTTNTVNVQQVMLALKSKNPQAFTSSNINALRQGAYLTVPNLSEIKRLSRVEAIRATKRQNIVWRTKKTAPSINTTRSNEEMARIQNENQRLRMRVSLLNEQLNLAYAESRQLANKLKQAQMAEASAPAASEISVDVARKVQKLNAEVNDLKVAVEEKDNYISSLRDKLRSASETIKRQQNDNQRIFAELKVSQAMQQNANIPASTPTQAVKPLLQLSAVNEEREASSTNSATSTAPNVSSNMQPANDVRLNQALPLSSTLKQPSDLAVTPEGDSSPVSVMELGIPALSAISLALVLLIGVLLWLRVKKHRDAKTYLPSPEKNKYVDFKE